MNMDPFGQMSANRRMHQNALMGMNNNNGRNNDPFQMMMSNPFSLMDSMMGNMNRMFAGDNMVCT